MTLEELSRRLDPHRDVLTRLDVASLSVFGSVGRDEARADSDVDVLVRFSKAPGFDRYMDLKLLLEEILGRRVDLVTDAAVRPELREQIEREAIRVA